MPTDSSVGLRCLSPSSFYPFAKRVPGTEGKLTCPKDPEIKGDHLLAPRKMVAKTGKRQKVRSGRFALGRERREHRIPSEHRDGTHRSFEASEQISWDRAPRGRSGSQGKCKCTSALEREGKEKKKRTRLG